MKSSKGFSLLEIMITIAVIGILSAVAIPSIVAQRNNAKLRDAASMIRGDFKMAHSRATRENASAVVQINTAGDGYTIFIDNVDTCKNIIVDNNTPVVTTTLCSGQLPTGIKIDLTKPIFTASLYPTLTCYSGSGYLTNPGIITLLGANGNTATLDLNNRFGRIKTQFCDNMGHCAEG